MKRFYPTALFVISLVFGLAPVAAQDRPNVVLVMADDMGWGETSYNGHPVLRTPHLDEMAAHGLRFNRFYAGGPVCSPTRATVLTGRAHDRTAFTRMVTPCAYRKRRSPRHCNPPAIAPAILANGISMDCKAPAYRSAPTILIIPAISVSMNGYPFPISST